jgi:hypothetical protein
MRTGSKKLLVLMSFIVNNVQLLVSKQVQTITQPYKSLMLMVSFNH